MTDRSLNQRLRQRSRRAGIMIGVSMALTIALCVGGFSVIYASMDGVVGDFVSRDPAASDETPVQGTQIAAQDSAPAGASDNPPAPTVGPTAAPEPTVPPTEAPASPPADAFEPDYQSSSDYSLNLRSEASSDGGNDTVVAVLPPASPLMYLDQDQPTNNPQQDGDRWMQFETEDGDTGWLREIDVETYEP